EMGSDDAHDRSAFAADGKAAAEHVDVVPVLVAEADFAFVRALAAPRAFVELTRAILVVWMQDALPRADVRLYFVPGVPEHLLPARRVEHHVGFEVPVPDAFLSAGEREGQPFLAFA